MVFNTASPQPPNSPPRPDRRSSYHLIRAAFSDRATRRKTIEWLTTESRTSLGFDLFPRNYVVRSGIVLGDPPPGYLPLGIGQEAWSRFRYDLFPAQFLHRTASRSSRESLWSPRDASVTDMGFSSNNHLLRYYHGS